MEKYRQEGTWILNWVYVKPDCFHIPKSQPRLLGSPTYKHTPIVNKESNRELNDPLKANQNLLTQSGDPTITGKCLLGGRGVYEMPQGTETVRSHFRQLTECFRVAMVSGSF